MKQNWLSWLWMLGGVVNLTISFSQSGKEWIPWVILATVQIGIGWVVMEIRGLR